MRLMAICHGAFCSGHAAHTVWTWGVFISSCGVLVLVMGRFTAVLGGAASPLPDSPPHGQRGRCPSHEAKSRAKLLGVGVTKSCAKLRKQISRNHRPTSPFAKREAQSLALHRSLQSAKLKAQRPQGVARRKVASEEGREPALLCFSPFRTGGRAQARLECGVPSRTRCRLCLFQHLVDIKIFHARKCSRAGTSCLYKH